MSRSCSICTHAEAATINKWIAEGKSFRVISRQILTDEKHHDSIRRHAQSCLKLEIQALIQAKKVKQAVDHYQEICDQLAFAKDLRAAAREFLSDPVTGNVSLVPRADEITVIYDDYSDCNSKGEPKRRKDTLAKLLERAEAVNITGVQTIIKHVDVRSFALDAIRTADTVLDKIAKLEGLYTKERENEKKLDSTVRAVLDYLEDYPEEKQNLEIVIKDFAKGRIVNQEELKEKVLQELNNVQ